MYHIVAKIEKVNGEIIVTPIGYVDNEDDVNIIRGYTEPYITWLNNNREAISEGRVQMGDYLDNNPPYYDIHWSSGNIDGLNLPLITDVNNL